MKFIIPFLILLFFVSCSTPEENSAGKEKLSKEKMIEVLLDVHLSEATLGGADRNQKKIQQEMASDYEKIFRRHKISGSDFYDTYNYYLSHPDLMDSVYNELVSHITTFHGQLKLQQPKVPDLDSVAIRDSLKNKMLHKFKRHTDKQ